MRALDLSRELTRKIVELEMEIERLKADRSADHVVVDPRCDKGMHCYSRSMNQPYPRLCTRCREPEPERKGRISRRPMPAGDGLTKFNMRTSHEESDRYGQSVVADAEQLMQDQFAKNTAALVEENTQLRLSLREMLVQANAHPAGVGHWEQRHRAQELLGEEVG